MFLPALSVNFWPKLVIFDQVSSFCREFIVFLPILCYSLLKSGIYEDFQQLSMIFGLLFDNDKASHYISKLEDKFGANTEKQEQVLVKYRDV